MCAPGSAFAAVGVPLTGDDIDLEIFSAADGAQEAVITAWVVGTTIGFKLVEMLEDVKGHRYPAPARW